MHDLLSTYLFLIPIVVGLFCEVVKFIIASIYQKRLAYEFFLHTGGFPSTHSAFVTSLLIIVWRKMGVDSVEFAIAAVFAAVIAYDAMSSRRVIGEQSEVLNQMQSLRKFKTRVGHSFVEVMGGVGFGAVVTWLGIWMSV